MNESIEAARKLAEQDDRILFIIVILAMGTGLVYSMRMVGRYFIHQHENLIVDFRNERTRATEAIKEANDARIATLEELSVIRQNESAEFSRCVGASTRAIEENTKVLMIVNDAINSCRKANS